MTLEQALPIATALDPDDKLRLIDELVRQLLQRRSPAGRTGASLRGALKELGPAPSLEDIAEARREMWASPPEEEAR